VLRKCVGDLRRSVADHRIARRRLSIGALPEEMMGYDCGQISISFARL